MYDKSEVHTCKKYSSFEIGPLVKRAKRTICELATTASSKIKMLIIAEAFHFFISSLRTLILCTQNGCGRSRGR